MSLFPEGRDWWVASDGHWYPPEQHPSAAAGRAPSPPPPPVVPPGSLPRLGSPLPPAGSVPPPWLTATPQRPPSAAFGPGAAPEPHRRAPRSTLTIGVVLVVLLAGIGVGVWLTSHATTVQNASSTSNSVSPMSPSSPATTQPGGGSGDGPSAGPSNGSAPSTGSGSPGSSGASSGSGAFPPVAPPAAPASGPLVTLAVAQQVFNTTWEEFATAFVNGDTAGIAQFTTPTVQHVIAGAFACGCRPWPLAYSQVSFTAPPQTTYPLSFYAEITGKDYDGTTQWRQVVFTQASATSPWLIAFMGVFNQGSPVLGSPATDTLAAPDPSSAATAAAAPAALTTFLQQLDANANTAPPPPGFETGGWFDQTVSGEQQNQATLQKDGETVTTVHTAGTPSTVFAGPGVALECVPIVLTATYRHSDGTPLLQPQDLSGWGVFQAPGSFSSITQTGVTDWCVETFGSQTEITSIWGGVYQSIGVPA